MSRPLKHRPTLVSCLGLVALVACGGPKASPADTTEASPADTTVDESVDATGGYSSCAENPGCDPPFGGSLNCDIEVYGIPFAGAASVEEFEKSLVGLGGAPVVCLIPVR